MQRNKNFPKTFDQIARQALVAENMPLLPDLLFKLGYLGSRLALVIKIRGLAFIHGNVRPKVPFQHFDHVIIDGAAVFFA